MRLWLLPLVLAACTPLPDLFQNDPPAGQTPPLMALDKLVGTVTPPATAKDIADLQARGDALSARGDALRAR
ncbi:MAG: hypothetical protein ACPG7W_01665 [Paracoccaceae bacterium]